MAPTDGVEVLTRWVEKLQDLLIGLDQRVTHKDDRIKNIVPDMKKAVDEKIQRQQMACEKKWTDDLDEFVSVEVSRIVASMSPGVDSTKGVFLTWKMAIIAIIVIAALVGAPWAIDLVNLLVGRLAGA